MLCLLSILSRHLINKGCNDQISSIAGVTATHANTREPNSPQKAVAAEQSETAARPVNALVLLQKYLAMQS